MDRPVPIHVATSGHPDIILPEQSPHFLCVRPVGHLDGITSAVISDDGQCAVTLAYDNSARLWDMQSGACRSVLPHAAAVTRAVFSPDGLLLLTASADHQALLWSCEVKEQPACRLLRIFKVRAQASQQQALVFLFAVAAFLCRVGEGALSMARICFPEC